jgi:hypothetical protein
MGGTGIEHCRGCPATHFGSEKRFVSSYAYEKRQGITLNPTLWPLLQFLTHAAPQSNGKIAADRTVSSPNPLLRLPTG